MNTRREKSQKETHETHESHETHVVKLHMPLFSLILEEGGEQTY
jgi:hypothetical protein